VAAAAAAAADAEAAAAAVAARDAAVRDAESAKAALEALQEKYAFVGACLQGKEEELAALRDSLGLLPALSAALHGCGAPRLCSLELLHLHALERADDEAAAFRLRLLHESVAIAHRCGVALAQLVVGS
jgi:hypothetical protein